MSVACVAAGTAVRNNNEKKKAIIKGGSVVKRKKTLRDVPSAKDFEEDAHDTEMPTSDKRIYSGTFDKKVSAIECLLCLAQSVTTMCPYCCEYCCVSLAAQPIYSWIHKSN